jgi:hypothetical protein
VGLLRLVAAFGILSSVMCTAQTPLVEIDRASSPASFTIAANGAAAAIYVSPRSPETVRVAAQAFASDVERVTGVKPALLSSLAGPLPSNLILVGTLGQSPEIDALKLDTAAVAGKWEAALTTVVDDPMPGVRRALVIAGSDRRGAAFALFTLSRQMGVSPWTWWADVPVPHHAAVYVAAGAHVQASPSVQYRGIFFNDEDWGLRPWAAKKMDPHVDGGKGNIGPNTYARVFELLLRLHANSLWPAMHPGSLAFNAVPENAKLADRYGIVMGSSHSEALLRNNVGEWNEKTDGPWNYQTNHAAMDKYWDKRLAENGKYENFYTVGLRGVHDSGLEATGKPQVKAKLVEDVMDAQRAILAKHIAEPLGQIPQVIWLYKESLDLYRVGMKVPPDVTLGWTDDNYGYLRELPTLAEQARPGGSGIYYHVSYWGSPHDYLWLCTTPPAQLREELSKAYDHNARRYWILNVGDLKPAELDIDYFMQLAWDEPRVSQLSQKAVLLRWAAEQFPTAPAPEIADILTRYYQLNFIRKPEFMGFNGYNDGINRTAFNPDAWGSPRIAPALNHGQNSARAAEWSQLVDDEVALARTIPSASRDAFFELVAYPVEAAAAQNLNFLFTDLTYLDQAHRDPAAATLDTGRAHAAYDRVQSLTARYNSLAGGKWDGMMSAAPRDRHVFEMPRTATEADAGMALPAAWSGGTPPDDTDWGEFVGGVHAGPPPGFHQRNGTVSIQAAHFVRKSDGGPAQWNLLPDLGISGPAVVYGSPGLLADAAAASAGQDAPWLEYDFTTASPAPATLTLHLLPTFPLDSDHRLRYAVVLDGGAPIEIDEAAAPPRRDAAAGDGPANSNWADGVLRNDALATIPLGRLTPGGHTLRLLYRDPGVVFQHLVIAFPGAPPAYPVPPETVVAP